MTDIVLSSIGAMLLANTNIHSSDSTVLQCNKHICTEHLMNTKFPRMESLKINIQLESRIADIKTNPPKLSNTLSW